MQGAGGAPPCGGCRALLACQPRRLVRGSLAPSLTLALRLPAPRPAGAAPEQRDPAVSLRELQESIVSMEGARAGDVAYQKARHQLGM